MFADSKFRLMAGDVALGLLLAVIALFCAPAVAAPIESQAKPNVLILLADDLGINDISFNNDGKLVSTPNIDTLAKQGHYFHQFYTDSTCSPSRAALLTGLHPSRVGFTPVGTGISPQLITLPELLHNNGYNTFHVGKWHLGEDHPLSYPERQGFTKSFGFIDQWKLQGPENGEWKNKPPTYFNPWLRDEADNTKQFQGHLEDILTRHTEAIIRSEHDKPWFIYHAFFAPHEPMQAAARYVQDYGNTGRGKYKSLVKQLDDSVGKLISALQETGQLHNTLIIFLSDNGGTERYFPSNYPVFGKKGDYKGGGMRAPMAMYWKGKFSSREITKPVVIYDVYPSLVKLLGLPSAKTDGVDFYAAASSPRQKFLGTAEKSAEENDNAVSNNAHLNFQNEHQNHYQRHHYVFWDKHDSHAVLDVNNSELWWAGFLGNHLSQKLVSTKYGLINFELRDDAWSWPLLNHSLQKMFIDWKFTVSKVNALQREDETFRYFSGDDFRRSLGSRNHAMLFALSKNGLQPGTILLEQKNVFKLYLSKDQRLMFQIHGQNFDWGEVTKSCQAMLINSDIQYSKDGLWGKPAKSQLSVFVEGRWKHHEFLFEQPFVDIQSETVVNKKAIKHFQLYSMNMNPQHKLWGEQVRASMHSVCSEQDTYAQVQAAGAPL